MSSSPHPEATSSKWLFAVRALVLCSILAILVPWYAAIFHDFTQRDILNLFGPIVFSPLWLPFAWVFWGLRSNADVQTVKENLAVAVVGGSLLLILCLFLVAVSSFDADRPLVIVYVLVTLLQIALLACVIRAYYSMKREPKDLQILTTRLWFPIMGIVAAAIVVPNLFLHESPMYESVAVGSLRTINDAQAEYARTHPDKGFAQSLAELGLAGLIDSTLASGRRSRYVFVLTVAPSDSHGRTSHYTVVARPQKYSKEGKRSFFTDDSCVLRFTDDNRVSTPTDRILQ